jgi:hypothetical protein
MTKMPSKNQNKFNETFDATGIHWQVAQATSLHNLQFRMPPRGDAVTHRGIFTEQGSGGFVSGMSLLQEPTKKLKTCTKSDYRPGMTYNDDTSYTILTLHLIGIHWW